MKKIFFLSIVLIFVSVSIRAMEPSVADNDLASAVISSEASINEEVLKLFHSSLDNPDSKISKALKSYRKELAPINTSDLILIQRSSQGGVITASYLLPIRIMKISSIKTAKYIFVEYISDSTEEEINLSTRIYLSRLVDVEIKDQK